MISFLKVSHYIAPDLLRITSPVIPSFINQWRTLNRVRDITGKSPAPPHQTKLILLRNPINCIRFWFGVRCTDWLYLVTNYFKPGKNL